MAEGKLEQIHHREVDERKRSLVYSVLLVIVVVAWLALRYARGFVHGVFKTLLDREATEGTAQELTAVELQRQDARRAGGRGPPGEKAGQGRKRE